MPMPWAGPMPRPTCGGHGAVRWGTGGPRRAAQIAPGGNINISFYVICIYIYIDIVYIHIGMYIYIYIYITYIYLFIYLHAQYTNICIYATICIYVEHMSAKHTYIYMWWIETNYLSHASHPAIQSGISAPPWKISPSRKLGCTSAPAACVHMADPYLLRCHGRSS